MHDIASLATPNFHWFEAAQNHRASRPWTIYPAAFYAIPVSAKRADVVVSGDGGAIVVAGAVPATKTPNILGLDALTARISRGGHPDLTPEFRRAAAEALAVNAADKSSIAEWAKKLATSTFKR